MDISVGGLDCVFTLLILEMRLILFVFFIVVVLLYYIYTLLAQNLHMQLDNTILQGIKDLKGIIIKFTDSCVKQLLYSLSTYVILFYLKHNLLNI